MEIIVRAAEPDYGPEMGEAHVLAWQVGYRGLLPDTHLDGLSSEDRGRFWTEHLQQQLKKPQDPLGVATTVAEISGRVVGLTSFGPYRPVDDPDPDAESLCELWSLNVHPDFWGTGAAQALMTHVIDELSANRSEPRVALWVLEGNGRGRRFYEKVGWSQDGSEKSEQFAGATITELRYVREL